MKLSLNVGLTWPEVEHLYSVGYKGWTVGKLWFATDTLTGAMTWEWHLCIPMNLPDDAKGVAGSKPEALQALADCLQQLILRTPPDRLERAFLLAEASGLKFSSGEAMEFDVGERKASPEPPRPLAARTIRVPVQSTPQVVAQSHPIAPVAAERVAEPAAVVVARKRLPAIKVRMIPGLTRVQATVVPSKTEDVGRSNLPPGTDRG
jgi:hypothetical protein